MSEQLGGATVGDIVASDYRATGVFERFGIDFCCGGRRSLVEACRNAAADPDAVIGELEALPPLAQPHNEVPSWPLDRLVDHVEAIHHAYVRAALPRIGRLIAQLVDAHGERHPELALVAAAFDRLAASSTSIS
jgi:regulator of cell morphogenesis and NO signaling